MGIKKSSPGTPGRVTQGSGILCTSERVDHTPAALALQAGLLASRYGFTPGIAEIVATLAFGTGALR